MSFITKRERVFNEYDLFDLPSRNEGKMKAYASCTDARAWSHFCSDKTEHLVELIKRNNEISRPKYVPTDVIVETLMVAKNAEIGKLRHKIEEFEQMMAAYDQLDLTCAQKCEIASAHAAIKAANKELDELCLDLDLSGFTEGMESDAYETGKSRGDELCCGHPRCDERMSIGSESVKSRGDEWNFGPYGRKDSKSNQTVIVCSCDVATAVHDPRIQEMHDVIISKDAKLNAMQNTIAVMENDVCEPYCLYAHIYTALEKIFGVLCQNEKYKMYLNLMTTGKDTRGIDIKGKILYKLKILEKFSLALIAPCSQQDEKNLTIDCACLRTEVVERIDLAPVDIGKSNLDSKRAQLVADIMENDEMKEIISKESSSIRNEDDQTDDGIDNYSIETENLKRLKNLQQNYDELMMCYEKVKYEKDCLLGKCIQYEELEKEFENLQSQLREYNSLWNEKEHYRTRSSNIDSLKEQYLVLSNETSCLETQLKAESEISLMKSNTIDELRNENIALEKKLNEARIAFDKDKNALECRLKETDCTVMCQEQQIKSLSLQIDRLLEHGHDRGQEDPERSLALMNELESYKEETKNLRDSLGCCKEEKQHLQDVFQEKLRIINDLKMEIEDWKSSYEKAIQRNNHLEEYTNDCQEQVHRLIEENKSLSEDIREKSSAIENLRSVIKSKSHQMETLMDEIEKKDDEKKNLYKQLHGLQESYKKSATSIESEKADALTSLQLVRHKSQEMLEKVRTFSPSANNSDNNLTVTMSPNAVKALSSFQKLNDREDRNSLIGEIQKVNDVNSLLFNNIENLQYEINEYKTSLELTKKESEILEQKIKGFEFVTNEMDALKSAHDNLNIEKNELENDLKNKKKELESALNSIQLSKAERKELFEKLEHLRTVQEELVDLNNANSKLFSEKSSLQKILSDKTEELENMMESLGTQNEDLMKTSSKVRALENDLVNMKNINENISKKNNDLIDDLNAQIGENRNLKDKIKVLERNHQLSQDDVIALQHESFETQSTLEEIRKESAELINKLKHYETLDCEYDEIKKENESLKNELNRLTDIVKKVQQDNHHLSNENENLNSINEGLEKSLIQTRNQLISKPGTPSVTYEDVLTELENMKKEKILSQHKIKDLINKLDESDNTISNLTEDIIARNDKIAILENHINELEDEIRKLHESFGKVIDTGEELSSNSFEKYDHSLRSLEAHHSRAAHNLQMDLAKVKNENTKLGEQLSATKLKTEESWRDKNKYLSQVIHLQKERSSIASNIKELEKKSIGDSDLIPEHCSMEDMITSLDRISKSIDVKSSRSTSLEQKILKVQTSSQLLKNKADEAKKIIEKEKQKILLEKEEAIREKIAMENRLDDLKKKLENQKSRDQEIIEDLEANVQNQKLIAQNTISELLALQNSYRNSTTAVEELQAKIRKISDENQQYIQHKEMNESLATEVKQKTEIIMKLQKELDEFKSNSCTDIGVQILAPNVQSKACQTETLYSAELQSLIGDDPKVSIHRREKNVADDIPKNAKEVNDTSEIKPMLNLLQKQNQCTVNEVQILAANIEPSFDFVKSSYLNYKIQRLGPGKLEQHSFSNENSLTHSSQVQDNQESENDSCLIDIYNDSNNSGSSKFNTIDLNNQNVSKQNPNTNLTVYTGLIASDVKNVKNNKTAQPPDVKSKSKLSDSEDVLVIYKDKSHNKNLQQETVPKTVHQNEFKQNSSNDAIQKGKNYVKTELSLGLQEYSPENEVDTEGDEDDSVKPKLHIKLPRVHNDSQSVITNNNTNKNSMDSVTDIYLSPKHSFMRVNIDHTETIKKKKQLIPHRKNKKQKTNYNHNLRSSSDDDMVIPRDINSDLISTKPHERGQALVTQKLERYNKSVEKTEFIDAATMLDNKNSQHKLSRVDADPYLIKSESHNIQDLDVITSTKKSQKHQSFALDYILDTVKRENDSEKLYDTIKDPRQSKSDARLLKNLNNSQDSDHLERLNSSTKASSPEFLHMLSPGRSSGTFNEKSPSMLQTEKPVTENVDNAKDYKDKIMFLTRNLEITERDFKKKLEAIKLQYDNNIKNIINEHNQGVKNIQSLHEDTLQDIIKIHENEIENLRTISMDANRKADKLERENRSLKNKSQVDYSSTGLDEEPIRISSDIKKSRKQRTSSKMLTKTDVVACNLKPEIRSNGPCTCSLDVNISDTIRNIFEQVDVDQRKVAEYTYMKYIAKKIFSGNVEALDAQELSFLHLKVCRTWKMKLSQEEVLKKRIDNLESELLNRQRHAQQHIAELDRKLEEEKRRLQEVREAVCRTTPVASRTVSLESGGRFVSPPPAEKEHVYPCTPGLCGMPIAERRSAGDLLPEAPVVVLRPKRTRVENNRAVSAKFEAEEKREKKFYHDDPPTKLRRSHDRPTARLHKK